MTYSRRFLAMLASCITAAAVVAVQASAGQIFKERFHEEDTRIWENFCGVDGLTVRQTSVVDGWLTAVSQGRDHLPHFRQHVRETQVATVVSTGETFTHVWTGNTTDVKVTDNGDGTLTVVLQGAGGDVLYGSDGKAIARDPGMGRFAILVDHGGTPTDPSDDEFLADLGVVKEPTGPNDDFCAATAEAVA